MERDCLKFEVQNRHWRRKQPDSVQPRVFRAPHASRRSSSGLSKRDASPLQSLPGTVALRRLPPPSRFSPSVKSQGGRITAGPGHQPNSLGLPQHFAIDSHVKAPFLRSPASVNDAVSSQSLRDWGRTDLCMCIYAHIHTCMPGCAPKEGVCNGARAHSRYIRYYMAHVLHGALCDNPLSNVGAKALVGGQDPRARASSGNLELRKQRDTPCYIPVAYLHLCFALG